MNKIYYAIIWVLLIGIGLIIVLPNGMHHDTPSSIWAQHTGDIMSWGNTTTTGVDLISWNINSLVYTNTEYWFQLTLPRWWEGYRVFIYTGSGIDSWVSIKFALPTLENNRYWILDPNDNNRLIAWYTGEYKHIKWYAELITINIWSHEWYEYAKKNNEMRNNEVWKEYTWWENNKYIFSIARPQDLPIDIMSSRWKRDYFQQIKNTFKSL